MRTAEKAPNESRFPLDELEAVAMFLRDHGFFVVRRNAVSNSNLWKLISFAEKRYAGK